MEIKVNYNNMEHAFSFIVLLSLPSIVVRDNFFLHLSKRKYAARAFYVLSYSR